MASVAVSCHEAGHAVQNVAPSRVRSALVPVGEFGVTAAWTMSFLLVSCSMFQA